MHFLPTFVFVMSSLIFVGFVVFVGCEIGKSQYPSNGKPDGDGVNNNNLTGQTIGGVVGAIVAIVTISLVYWFWFRKQNFETPSQSHGSPIFTVKDLETMKIYGALPEQVTRRNESR